MELVTIILSSLLSIFSNGGWLIEAIANKQLSSYLESAEKLAIRVDNTPNYQIARGRIDRLRIAGRGIYLEPYLRIAVLELETDPIALDLAKLSKSTQSLARLRGSLEKPLQGAVSIVITERDLLNALRSETLIAKLQANLNNLVASKAGASTISYQLIQPRIELKPHNSLTIKATLRRSGMTMRKDRNLAIALKLKLKVIQGQQIQLSKLAGTVNNRPISDRLLKGFAEGISDRLNLATMEKQGIFARLLQLEITEDKIKIVGFTKMETKSIPISSTVD
jgi:hypothetical protein